MTVVIAVASAEVANETTMAVSLVVMKMTVADSNHVAAEATIADGSVTPVGTRKRPGWGGSIAIVDQSRQGRHRMPARLRLNHNVNLGIVRFAE